VQRFGLGVATSVSLAAVPLLLCLPLMVLFHLSPSKVALVAHTGGLTGLVFAFVTLGLEISSQSGHILIEGCREVRRE
jgi:hypothetical protein